MAKRKKSLSRGKSLSKKKKRARVRFLLVVGAIFVIIVSFALFHFVWEQRQKVFNSFNEAPYMFKYSVRGVDVSHHNSFINWEQLREEKITFAYLKSTEGINHKDRDYKKNYKLAREAGLKVGTYHFYSFGVDGKKQAQHFIRNSKVISGDMIPAIDVEHSRYNRSCRTKAELQKMLKELRALESQLFEHYGKRPVIYTNKDCYRQYIENNFPDNPIWICDLHNEPNIESGWDIWQFSHTGNIPGVIDEIDLNYYRYSFADFHKMLIP